MTRSRAKSEPGVVGPNAVIQLRAALIGAGQADCLPGLFAAAGHPEYLADPPIRPVPQADIARLFQILPGYAAMPERMLADAGRRTAEYLLTHRIPRAVRTVLPYLPRRMAAAILTRAIGHNAWTFAGSGRFRAEGGRNLNLVITANPLCLRPGCVWHQAVFQRLFQAMVCSKVVITETACTGAGAPACRFAVTIGARSLSD